MADRATPSTLRFGAPAPAPDPAATLNRGSVHSRVPFWILQGSREIWLRSRAIWLRRFPMMGEKRSFVEFETLKILSDSRGARGD